MCGREKSGLIGTIDHGESNLNLGAPIIHSITALPEPRLKESNPLFLTKGYKISICTNMARTRSGEGALHRYAAAAMRRSSLSGEG